MGTDRGAILKQAQLYTSRGQYDKAIAEWQKLIARTHADGPVHNSIGDLQVKRNCPSDAIEAYLEAAAAYKACGDPLKAIAIYRKIIKLDPNRLTVYQQLGDLNAERGLISSAIGDYTTLCKLLQKAGRTRDALQVYRKMAQTDPSNVEIKQRLAELCVQETMPAEAVDAYLALGKEYHAQHRREEAQRAYESARKIDPHSTKVEKAIKSLDHPAAAQREASGAATVSSKSEAGRRVLLETANQQIQSGEYTDAEAALMEMLTREPGDPEVCRLLARLHLKRGELSVAMGEFQFLAGAAMRAEEYGLAESMLTEYLAVEPRCVMLIESLAQVYEHKGDIPGAVARYSEALALLLAHPEPDQLTSSADLLGKLKELAPGSKQVAQFTRALINGSTAAVGSNPVTVEPLADSSVDPGQTDPAEAQRPTEAEPLPSEVFESEVMQAASMAEVVSVPTTGEVTATADPVEPPSVEEAAVGLAPADVQEVLVAPSSREPQMPVDDSQSESLAPDEGPAVVAEEELPAPGPVPGTTEPEPRGQDEVLRPPVGVQEEPAAVAIRLVMDEDEARARYELGVAYKDMGLFDEAFEEFRQTVAVKALFLDTCCMMADCFKEQGDSPTAITHYEQALTAARDNEPRLTEIRYELGLLYEAEGMLENAVQVWSVIGPFRDASERLERIKGVHGPDSGPNGVAVLSATGQSAEPTRPTKKRRVSYL